MIKAEFDSNREEQTISMVITGHAGAAQYGQDIVCSAASILAYALGQSLMNHGATGALSHPPHVEETNGKFIVIQKCESVAEYIAATVAFGVTKTGYALLAMNYPDYVQMSEKLNDA